MLMLVS